MYKAKLLFKQNTFVGRNVTIDPEFNWLITIGNNSVITNGVTILAHDGSLSRHTGLTKLGRVTIGSNTFIGVKSIIMPGVNIGNNVIIGAGSIVTKDIPDNSIATGNPAEIFGSVFEYVEKHKEKMLFSPVFQHRGLISKKLISKMEIEWKEGIAYIGSNNKTSKKPQEK